MPLEPEGSTLIVASEELSVVCRGVSNQMGHLNLLIRFAAQPKGNHRTIFDNQLSLLQARYRGFYFQKFLARHTKEIFDDTIRDRLLFHDERILRIGVEVKELTLVAIHVLSGEDDAQPFVSTYGYQVSKWLIIEVQHIVSLINDSEMPNLHIVLVYSLFRQLLVDVVKFRNDEIDDSLGYWALFWKSIHLYDEAFIHQIYLVLRGEQMIAYQLL